MKYTKAKGFTLMEILVVISLLAILATVVMASYFTSLERGRDSRRKQDLEQVGRALELYYFENNVYPATTLPWGEALTNTGNTKTYMKKLPTDPSDKSNDGNYKYVYDSNGSYYKLYSCLENDKDLDYTNYNTNCGTDCQPCHYGISSPDIAL